MNKRHQSTTFAALLLLVVCACCENARWLCSGALQHDHFPPINVCCISCYCSPAVWSDDTVKIQDLGFTAYKTCRQDPSWLTPFTRSRPNSQTQHQPQPFTTLQHAALRQPPRQPQSLPPSCQRSHCRRPRSRVVRALPPTASPNNVRLNSPQGPQRPRLPRQAGRGMRRPRCPGCPCRRARAPGASLQGPPPESGP